MDMDYSPWYEDVRLFRHKEPGKKDWAEMMQRVKGQIKVENRDVAPEANQNTYTNRR
jgi:hypothetical protein